MRWIAFALLMVLSGCGGKDAQDKQAPLVDAYTVQQSDVVSTLNGVGTVRHRRETPVGFSEAGRVASLRFKEGDQVARGQLLAVLEGVALRSTRTASSAELEKARAKFEQIKSLQAQGFATNKQYAVAETAVLAAEGRLQPSGGGGEEIYAPTSGTVLSRLVQPGQNVSAGAATLVLGDDSGGFAFRVALSERDAAKLKKGMTGRIMIESLGHEPVEATIFDIEKVAGGAAVVFHLPAKAGLKSAQIGSVAIDLPEGVGGALKIPAGALFDIRPTAALVYIVDPKTNRLETRSVVLAGGTEGNAIVTAGLKPGDTIVMSGGKKLRSGMRVRTAAKGRAGT